tara:strand:- start:926 stop:2017 length:1092 start_codon:yes stop_codon:yes gene_type:complete
MNYDFLIVGQGITGSIVAFQLKKNLKKIKLIESDKPNTSSKVAAGIVHPISLKRCNLSWRGKEFFEFSNAFYKEINFESRIELYKPYKLLRIFASFEEQNNWIGKTNNEIYSNILTLNNKELINVKNKFGSGVVEHCSRLNVNDFLNFISCSFLNTEVLKKELFKAKELKLKNNKFHYKGDIYSKVIMCDGVNALKTPMFNYLPIIPNKGELLKVFSNILPPQIINCGIFSLPETKNIFTVGSTYSNEDLKNNVTIDAKEYLMKKLNKIIEIDGIEVIDQKFGFRPTTLDRKPFIGEHPIIKNLYTVNGMGSKAILMAPLLVRELLNYIYQKKPLDSIVDINRYAKNISNENIDYAKSLQFSF